MGDEDSGDEEVMKQFFVQFRDEQGEKSGTPFNISSKACNPLQLQKICNAVLANEDEQTYSFFVNDKEIVGDLESMVEKEKISTEGSIEIVYQPQASFKVRAVTRCSSSVQGHSGPVLTLQFSPCGRNLASGSGDKTVRFWDLNTQTPHHTCRGHKREILNVCWSPDGKKLASGCGSGLIMIWDPQTGKQIGKTMKYHKKEIQWLCWEPLHLNGECRRLASCSQDADVIVWDTKLQQREASLCGHMQAVRAMRWTGSGGQSSNTSEADKSGGLIITASRDCTIRVWTPKGLLVRILKGHGHWVNTLALNTDYVMRTGCYEPADAQTMDLKAYDQETAKSRQEKALKRYNQVVQTIGKEYMVSGSDDMSLSLWNPSESSKRIVQMTGHQAQVNDVRFSPDGKIIASASFDKCVKLWNGITGGFIASLRGHANAVYQVAFSADSRLLVSSSCDSTLKVWNVNKRKLMNDLPGHADEVFAVDWSTDGKKVASGGKDKVLKLWTK